MSQFFKDFDEENLQSQSKKQPIKIKSDSDELEGEERITNKDKKLQELQEEIFQLEETYNNRDIEQFIKNIKKYKLILKDQMPTFLYNFFNVALSKIKSAGTKNKIKKLLASHEKLKEESVEIQTNVAGLERIVVKEDEEEKLNELIISMSRKLSYVDLVRELLILKNSKTANNEKCKICLTLLNLHIKNKSLEFEMIGDLIDEVLVYLKQSQKFMGVNFNTYFENNIEIYLNYMMLICDHEHQPQFKVYLEKTKWLNNEVVCRKELEFIFYNCNENILNDDKIYRILYLIRSKLYEDAYNYYKANEHLYEDYLRIKVELGILAFESKAFMFSFEILQKCYFSGQKEQENLLFILCIILEEEVLESDFFDIFIDNLSILEDNIFMLKMNQVKGEIFRAYYMFKNEDYLSADRILEEVRPGFHLCKVMKKPISI